MSWFSNYLKSSVGAKHVMAVSGVILVGYVLVHMLGNLLVFAGQDALNAYAASLQANRALVWVVRLTLLAMVAVHIAASVRLTVINKAARPVKYHRFKPIASPFYARVMPWTGLIVLAFIVYHLLHFTLGTILHDYHSLMQTMPDGTVRHDVYSMVVRSFQLPVVAISYIVAMALLCMHLAHGVSSMFQSVGLNHPKYNSIIHNAGPVFAAVIFIGNSSIPIAILAGAVSLPGA